LVTDLSYFDAIVPCRVGGMLSTSVAKLLGSAPPLVEVAEIFAETFAERLDYPPAQISRLT
jgi:lipoate-protein ligase B